MDHHVPRTEILWRAALGANDLGFQQLWLDRGDDFLSDLVLERKNIAQVTVAAVGPNVLLSRGVNKLGVDAYTVAALAHAALQDVANAKFAGGTLHIDGFSFVGKRRISRDDKKPTQLGYGGDDILRNSVGEIFLLGIAAHVDERQDSDGRPLGGYPFTLASSRGDRSWGLVGQMYAVNTDWPGNVFDGLLAHIVEFKSKFVLYLVVYDARDQDAAGIGQCFQPCCDVNAVPINVVTIDDNIANIDADPELNAIFRRDFAVAVKHATLNVDSAAHCVDDADKFYQHPVSSGLNNSAAMFGDLGIDQFFAMCLELA